MTTFYALRYLPTVPLREVVEREVPAPKVVPE